MRRSARLLGQMATATKPVSELYSATAVKETRKGALKTEVKAELKTEWKEEVEFALKEEPKLESKIVGVEVEEEKKVRRKVGKEEKAVVDLEDLWGGRKWAPTPELSKSVLDALVSMHGSRSRGKERVPESTVVDSLVRTILSQNTTDVNSLKCFELLKARFSTWEELLETNDKEVADTIKLGGLSQIKTQRIKTIFRQVIADHGSISLEHLRSESTENVKKVLSQFKGVGPKTIACVLMFNLQRDEFPVDTHVTRISQRLGWCPDNATREETYEFLNKRLPDDLKYELHVLLVEHGKRLCQATRPQCNQCDVQPYCKTGLQRAPKRRKTTDEETHVEKHK